MGWMPSCVCAPTTSWRSLDPSEAIYWELSPIQQLLHSWVELPYGLIPLYQTFLQLGIMSHDYHLQVGLARAVGNSSRASKLKPFITLTVSKSSSCMSSLTIKWILLAITSSKKSELRILHSSLVIVLLLLTLHQLNFPFFSEKEILEWYQNLIAPRN
jgi:hypothetical protein